METVSPPTLFIFFKMELFWGLALAVLELFSGSLVWKMAPWFTQLQSHPGTCLVLSPLINEPCFFLAGIALSVLLSSCPTILATFIVAWSSDVLLSLVLTPTQAPLVPSSTDTAAQSYVFQMQALWLSYGLAPPLPCPSSL